MSAELDEARNWFEERIATQRRLDEALRSLFGGAKAFEVAQMIHDLCRMTAADAVRAILASSPQPSDAGRVDPLDCPTCGEALALHGMGPCNFKTPTEGTAATRPKGNDDGTGSATRDSSGNGDSDVRDRAQGVQPVEELHFCDYSTGPFICKGDRCDGHGEKEMSAYDAGCAANPVAHSAPKAPEPVCSYCRDTHFVESADGHGRRLMCARCPVPCQKCRVGGNGPYCETTPCPCDCHRTRVTPPAPKPDPAGEGARGILPADVTELHIRWLATGGMLGPDPADIYTRGRSDGEKAREAEIVALRGFMEWAKRYANLPGGPTMHRSVLVSQLTELESELAKAGKGTK